MKISHDFGHLMLVKKQNKTELSLLAHFYSTYHLWAKVFDCWRLKIHPNPTKLWCFLMKQASHSELEPLISQLSCFFACEKKSGSFLSLNKQCRFYWRICREMERIIIPRGPPHPKVSLFPTAPLSTAPPGWLSPTTPHSLWADPPEQLTPSLTIKYSNLVLWFLQLAFCSANRGLFY